MDTINAQDKKRWIAVLHVARKDRGLDECAYRALLEGATGVSSASDIKTAAQYDDAMAAFKALGFRFKPTARKRLPVVDAERNNLCTERQRYYIKGLWELASRARDERSLRAMLKRIGGVDDLRFLTKKAASALILALRTIAWKAGYNPDQAPGRERA
ncbi:MAG: hypothetical protein A2Y38_00295 [Spirochaetes bacterium GWB1_59_5]|nr:MAG: hypothetical protein A2Y38_00295 [Spirochaetes bacterium GWB1_59_5]